MRNLQHIIISAFFLFVFVAYGYCSPLPYNSNYASVKSQLTTPQIITEYMTAYFTYEGHWGYSPYDPDTFNSNRRGDCKDYATFFADILSSHGYTIHKYAFRYDTQNDWGHVVSIFTDTNGLQYVASNKGSSQQIYGPISSLNDAGAILIANGVLPSGSVSDQWLQYPANFTGQLLGSKGFSYNVNYQTAKTQLVSFQDPAIYMTAFFSFEEHPGEYAYSPEELNTRRAGDAKDFAVFSAQNAHSTIYSFRYNKTNNASHVISVSTYNSQYYFQSLQYFFGPVNTFDEITALLKANGHIPANCEVDNWQSYASSYTGPFPVAITPPDKSIPPAVLILLTE